MSTHKSRLTVSSVNATIRKTDGHEWKEYLWTIDLSKFPGLDNNTKTAEEYRLLIFRDPAGHPDITSQVFVLGADPTTPVDQKSLDNTNGNVETRITATVKIALGVGAGLGGGGVFVAFAIGCWMYRKKKDRKRRFSAVDPGDCLQNIKPQHDGELEKHILDDPGIAEAEKPLSHQGRLQGSQSLSTAVSAEKLLGDPSFQTIDSARTIDRLQAPSES
jgi:hypothetical protein